MVCGRVPEDRRGEKHVVFLTCMEHAPHPLILGIESSCDDTSAAVIRGPQVLSNVVANQALHAEVGGVVPEWASRAHLSKIQPVVQAALDKAGVAAADLDAIAYTLGPGLQGSLHVGTSFAKAMAWGLDIPSIPVHHMRAHILAHVLEPGLPPAYPFLCLTVSGGHTQLVKVRRPNDMEVLGQTLDDAAGEAFDKAARVVRLEVGDNRVIVNAMEGRGCYAEWDGARLHEALGATYPPTTRQLAALALPLLAAACPRPGNHALPSRCIGLSGEPPDAARAPLDCRVPWRPAIAPRASAW